MIGWRPKVAAIMVAASTISQPAQACWSTDAVQAAKIMNLNNLLMVSALRCRMGEYNFLNEYNRFVQSNRAHLAAQHGVVEQHFARFHGAKHASLALDAFNIGLANSFGAGHPTMGCREIKSLATEISADSLTVVSLVLAADRSVGEPDLPGGNCNSRIASSK